MSWVTGVGPKEKERRPRTGGAAKGREGEGEGRGGGGGVKGGVGGVKARESVVVHPPALLPPSLPCPVPLRAPTTAAEAAWRCSAPGASGSRTSDFVVRVMHHAAPAGDLPYTLHGAKVGAAASSRDRSVLMGLGEGSLAGVANGSRMRSTPPAHTRKASALGPSAISWDRIARLDEV